MKLSFKPLALVLSIAFAFTGKPSVQAALLAYEPFTNAPGTAIIGSGDGSGFSGPWQDFSSSGGVATNTSYAPGYTDTAGNVLLTSGGAGFFQGLTSGNTSMQPIRLFNFSRGTNGTDATATWISFLIVRQGPAGTLTGNPYGRGANVAHDLNSGSVQKLAIGNSSGVATNTVGLIPQGSSANLKSSTNTFGNFTNFVVVRIDHRAGALDDAWLFVNPDLGVEPSTSAAGASSPGAFDFSFDRVRVFAGGQSSAAQPYAEIVVDEYRVGETYADVTPHTNANSSVPAGPPVITNVRLSPDGVILSGSGGSTNGTYYVLAWTSLAVPSTSWPAIATNSFFGDGSFQCTNPVTPGGPAYFYRLLTGGLPSAGPTAPFITGQPPNLSVTEGSNATFTVTADGTAPLFYRWYFNTNTLLTFATGASLTITNAQSASAGTYSVVVSNSLGSVTSTDAILAVNPPPVAPTISAQPQSLTVTQGQNAAFMVTADGTGPLHYQWYFNTNTLLPDATNSSLTVTNAQDTDAGAYSVVITNLAGPVASPNAFLTVLVPPFITAQPENQSVVASNNVTFTVTAGGTAPLTYRWYFNTNTLLAYATGASLTITNARISDAGIYAVVVSNSVGSISSTNAMLTVSSNGLISGAFFVSPAGSDANSGTVDQPFLTISKGLNTIGNGGVLYLRERHLSAARQAESQPDSQPHQPHPYLGLPGRDAIDQHLRQFLGRHRPQRQMVSSQGPRQAYAGHNGINISGGFEPRGMLRRLLQQQHRPAYHRHHEYQLQSHFELRFLTATTTRHARPERRWLFGQVDFRPRQRVQRLPRLGKCRRRLGFVDGHQHRGHHQLLGLSSGHECVWRHGLGRQRQRF